MRIDQIFKRQANIDELLDHILPLVVDVPANSDCVIGNGVDHLAVCMRKPAVVLEEVAVPIYVSHDEFLIDQWIATHQICVARIIVDHQFVDLCQAVGVLFL